MKRFLAAALLLVLPLAASADDPPKQNILTPQEVADGWILLFDGKTTFGWTSPNGSKWSVVDGMLAPRKGKPGLLVTTTAFGDCDLSFEFQCTPDSPFELRVGADAEGNGGRVEETGKAPGSVLGGQAQAGWWKARFKVRGGEFTLINYEQRTLLGGVTIETSGPGRDRQRPERGHIALTGSGFVVRNIKLKPIDTKPLFNGKNLSGWKKYAGDKRRTKSQFSVTKEGWLHVKNGPGDLQTEGQWADFILQLDCKTNGKRLNSGIFFRCLPGQYQQGYEAQIHNGFLDKPAKEYTINVHDPKTHKLKEKKKEKYAASDYGTGAIYRRMPARFQMAKDGEWFTLTVAAHGRHIATWVNGVQVADWTDNRPDADNARQGYYPKKGPISIQGHDPTTDLHFRNIRIAELPPSKKK